MPGGGWHGGGAGAAAATAGPFLSKTNPLPLMPKQQGRLLVQAFDSLAQAR